MRKQTPTLNERSNPKSTTEQSPTQLLRADHKKVKSLFAEFEKSKNPNRQKEIFETTAKELKIHIMVEEEVFFMKERKNVLQRS